MGKKFNEEVQKLVSDLDTAFVSNPFTQNQSQTTPNIPSDLAQLEKLFELKEKGILTEEEFGLQKAKILGL